ncbi:MAG: hypothetical protein ABS79_07090 [Planctomycetes bacterium SCN 63-9]|nr:MAG: hypothetical protein ABS79_07090 [Planctomycetes bacterium SCN 63-9]
MTGIIGGFGPLIEIKVMQSLPRVNALKRAGQKYSSPLIIKGLIDTGAFISALDPEIICALGLSPRGSIMIHTPSSGPDRTPCDTYDACFIIGEKEVCSLSPNISVLSCELKSMGISALIGRNVLDLCRFEYNGPMKTYCIEYDKSLKS